MNRIFFFIGALFFLSCNNPENKGLFTVKGELKNTADQEVFLEQISFNQQAPLVLDTATMNKGRFEMKAVSPEEGLYRLRFQKNAGYIFINDKPEGATGFIVKSDEFFIPLEGEIDMKKEKENMIKELEYTKGFLATIEKKLSNERFVSTAPPKVVEMENRKKADAEAKIKALEEGISQL